MAGKDLTLTEPSWMVVSIDELKTSPAEVARLLTSPELNARFRQILATPRTEAGAIDLSGRMLTARYQHTVSQHALVCPCHNPIP